MTLYEYFDGQMIKQDNAELFSFLQNAGLLHKGEKNSVRFCGLINIKDELHFFWPKTFQKNEREVFGSARLLLSTIANYSQNKGSTTSLSLSDDSEIEGIEPSLALEVLKDFLQYGLYQNSISEIERKNSGKISWPHVIKKSIPFLGSGTPIYMDFFVRKVNYFSENEITHIHAVIIARLDKVFGWYFTQNVQGIAPHLDNTLSFSEQKAIFLLKKERAIVYSDRELRLINNIIHLLESQFISSDTDKFFTGIKNFEHVWEAMCSELYCNDIEDFKNIIPYPAYSINGELHPALSNKQRMDIILSDGDEIAIIDAKYYDITVSRPSWSDLVKQFYYEKSLSVVLEERKITNFFIIPKASIKNPPESVAIIDDQRQKLSDTFPDIKIIYKDIGEVMEDYSEQSIVTKYRDEILPSKKTFD